MKLLTYVSLLGLTATAFAASPPHLDLELTSPEYRQLLEKTSTLKSSTFPAIERGIALGERLARWIALVNEGRTPATAIRLTSKTSRTGIPMGKPNIYSPTMIQRDTETILAALPGGIREVLTAEGALPGTLPVDDVTFIKHARLIDRNYQSAARFKMLIPWKSYYVQRAGNDVRGYYYFTSSKLGPDHLRDAGSIPAEKVAPVKDALVKLCLNARAGDLVSCGRTVERAWAQNDLVTLYESHFPHGERIWNEFFRIPLNGRRRDVTWTDEVMGVVFNTPSVPKFIPYLQLNIEDEYRFGNWGLQMTFGTYPNGPRLTFKPGETPHVNGLGGNEIVMDSNQPIEEYESQWTIRHEFGHVLGLPDCYHEFYDEKLEAFVNYQLDVTDLMCSRAGNMNERIYQELKGAYKK